MFVTIFHWWIFAMNTFNILCKISLAFICLLFILESVLGFSSFLVFFVFSPHCMWWFRFFVFCFLTCTNLFSAIHPYIGLYSIENNFINRKWAWWQTIHSVQTQNGHFNYTIHKSSWKLFLSETYKLLKHVLCVSVSLWKKPIYFSFFLFP